MSYSKTSPTNSDTDITDAELEAIQQKVDEEIERNGMPTDEQLRQEIEKMNADHPEPMASAEPNHVQYEVIGEVSALT